MIYQLLAVGAGGFLGAVFRSFSLLIFANKLGLSSIYGVLFVNVLGSFIAGTFTGLPENMQGSYLRYFIITGFLGALTTFSAFSLASYWSAQARAATAGLLKSGSSGFVAFFNCSSMALKAAKNFNFHARAFCPVKLMTSKENPSRFMR